MTQRDGYESTSSSQMAIKTKDHEQTNFNRLLMLNAIEIEMKLKKGVVLRIINNAPVKILLSKLQGCNRYRKNQTKA